MTNSNMTVNDKASFGVQKGLSEVLTLTGTLHIQLFGPDGELKEERFLTNTVTAAGKAGIANQMIAAPTLPKMGWMAVGTGAPSATLLGAEIARVAFASRTVLTNVVSVSATFPAGTGTGAWTEAGTFDVVTANTANMWMSTTFGVMTKAAGDSITINWNLTFN